MLRGAQVMITLKYNFEFRQATLHIETLNMMTKYQLVYVKLETVVYKILATNNARKKLRLKKAF